MKTLISSLALALALGAASAQAQSGLDINGQCIGDANGDTAVSIDELVAAVNNALSGCPQRSIALQFRAKVGEQAFACGTQYEGIGTKSSSLMPSDFRFYVSDIRLVTTNGDEVPLTLEQDGIWQLQNLAFLDFEDGTGPCREFGNAAINSTVRGTVPAGIYNGVRFTLGIPPVLNHGDASTAPSPLNVTSMFWSWRTGYKFIRVDTADDKYRIHLGSTGCTGTPPVTPVTCTRPNQPAVELSGFDPDTSVIVADLAALLADSDIDFNEIDTPPGCMSGADDLDCETLFANFGLSFADGSSDPTQQKFFRLE